MRTDPPSNLILKRNCYNVAYYQQMSENRPPFKLNFKEELLSDISWYNALFPSNCNHKIALRAGYLAPPLGWLLIGISIGIGSTIVLYCPSLLVLVLSQQFCIGIGIESTILYWYWY